jgi:predicted O-methyltransferase YrrM
MTTERREERLHDGVHYPTGHLIAVLEDARGAEQAARALRDAGFDDVVVFNGQEGLRAIENNEDKENPLRRAWEQLSIQMSDETDWRRVHLEALREGHALVMVHVPQRGQMDQAEGILKAHQARAIQFFGRWTITDLKM